MPLILSTSWHNGEGTIDPPCGVLWLLALATCMLAPERNRKEACQILSVFTEGELQGILCPVHMIEACLLTWGGGLQVQGCEGCAQLWEQQLLRHWGLLH